MATDPNRSNCTEDTIVAIASAPGPALRGIVRFSGAASRSVIEALVDIAGGRFPSDANSVSSTARYDGTIAIDAASELRLDVQVLLWPAGRSFTRQPSAEIHAVGSLPLLHWIVQRSTELGCRLAEPGEFTMRAFLSGRIELTQAEAILGMIDAVNERQFQSAQRQLAGGIGGPILAAKEQLLHVLAELEAGLDFVDEDIEFISSDELCDRLRSAEDDIRATKRQLQQRQLARESFTVALVGPPNVGKSSLFNRLSGANAIVSELAGTTRDYLAADCLIDGISVRLIDTAGWEPAAAQGDREDADTLASQMNRQTLSVIQDADFLLLCSDDPTAHHVNETWLQQTQSRKTDRIERFIPVRTKADIAVEDANDEYTIVTSAKTGKGVETLRARIHQQVEQMRHSDTAFSATLDRCFESLLQAEQSLQIAIESAVSHAGDEIVAAELRNVLNDLGKIVGTVYTDDILDVIFGKFCIGK